MLGCALAIGGLDPGGGAGVLADVRAFHRAGVFGCAAVALITIQSTEGLVASYPVAASRVLAQAAEVTRGQRLSVIKVGALGSVSNVRAVALWLEGKTIPVVVDPVMLPTRGASRLLAERATDVLRNELLPRATIVTANAREAAALTGAPVSTVRDAKRAARQLMELGPRAVLVKGGHLARHRDVVDVLALETGEILELRAARLALSPTHGGGCVLASLIAGYLARLVNTGGRVDSRAVLACVKRARAVHRKALVAAVDVGGAMRVLVP